MCLLLSLLGIALLATPAWCNPTCESFSEGVSYEESEALGIWYLIHFRAKDMMGDGVTHCLQLTEVEKEDQDVLNATYSKLSFGVDWSKVTLIMTIHCQELQHLKQRHFYLEKIGGVGAYRTLLLPTSVKFSYKSLSRSDIHLKLVEDKYLSAMDCEEQHVFIFSKKYPTGSDTERRLAKSLDDYWGNDASVAQRSPGLFVM